MDRGVRVMMKASKRTDRLEIDFGQLRHVELFLRRACAVLEAGDRSATEPTLVETGDRVAASSQRPRRATIGAIQGIRSPYCRSITPSVARRTRRASAPSIELS